LRLPLPFGRDEGSPGREAISELAMRPVLFLASLLAAAACVHESSDVLPVSTTAEGQRSTIPAAAEAARRDQGFVRFIQAIPDVASADLYAGDMRVFTSAAYGTVTPFKEIPEGLYEFKARPAGQEMAVALAEEHEHIDEGEHNTVVAFRKANDAKASMKVFEDELTPPKAGTAKVRLINASPDAGELEAYTPGSEKAVIDDVNFGDKSKYAEIKPLTGKVAIHREHEKTPLYELPTTTFDAGKVYTIVVLGWAKGSPSSLRTLVIEDRFGTP
jgi:hypothetical protein